MTADPILPRAREVKDRAPKADRPVLVLIGQDGNAFNILGKARRALLLAGRGDEWAIFVADATSSDYQHLLATVMDWFEVE
jgi:hypothetical protein